LQLYLSFDIIKEKLKLKECLNVNIIEKENGQIFEVYKSRKEFAEMVKDLTWSDSGIWEDEDSSLELIYKDGTQANYTLGDKKKPLRLNEIVKGCYNNSCTNAIYKCDIVSNEHYEDYEVKI